MSSLKSFIKDEDGLTAIEYVIAAGLLATGLVALFGGFGTTLKNKLDAIIAAI